MAEDNVSNIVEAFKILDRQIDGKVGTAELRHVLTSMGHKLGNEIMSELIRVADADRDGKVNFDELVRALEKEEPIAKLGDTGIKKIKMCDPYVSSEPRELRDQIRAFQVNKEFVESATDKLWKVLAPDLAVGFTKTDLLEFIPYIQSACNLDPSLLTDAKLDKDIKAAGIKEKGNHKPGLGSFLDKLLANQQAAAEAKLSADQKL